MHDYALYLFNPHDSHSRTWPHWFSFCATRDATALHYQVTGASGFIGSHVVDELLRQGYSVRGLANILSLHTTQYTYEPLTVVSAVRSHNVARISKSYESFGDRFTATIVDDLATSDFSQAVKGVCSRQSVIYFWKLNAPQVLMPLSMSRPRSPMRLPLKPS